jgi:two-component system chemotaxis response regulator CheY
MQKALVVDDSRAIRGILKRMLGEYGFEVLQASDGVEGLRALEGEAADISLLCVDYNMPNMNGIELLRNMRANSRFKNLPAIMITTETHLSSMVAAFEAGANEYIMKPFTVEMLAEKLRIVGVVAE